MPKIKVFLQNGILCPFHHSNILKTLFLEVLNKHVPVSNIKIRGNSPPHIKAIFHKAEFSARNDNYFVFLRPLFPNWSLNKRKFHFARKILASGRQVKQKLLKQPQSLQLTQLFRLDFINLRNCRHYEFVD